MASSELLSTALDSDIAMIHQRFMTAMKGRLPTMALDTKERYFAVLSSLVGKLEAPEKGLRDVLQEMMSEVGAIIFQEISAGR